MSKKTNKKFTIVIKTDSIKARYVKQEEYRDRFGQKSILTGQIYLFYQILVTFKLMIC